MYHTKYSIIILNTKRQKKTIKCSMTEKLSLKKDQKNTTLQKKWFESHIGATMHWERTIKYLTYSQAKPEFFSQFEVIYFVY